MSIKRENEKLSEKTARLALAYGKGADGLRKYKLGWSDYPAIRDLASNPAQVPATVTAEEYDDMLGCVPPRYLNGLDGFLVGEALTGDDRGTVYANYFVSADRQFMARYHCVPHKSGTRTGRFSGSAYDAAGELIKAQMPKADGARVVGKSPDLAAPFSGFKFGPSSYGGYQGTGLVGLVQVAAPINPYPDILATPANIMRECPECGDADHLYQTAEIIWKPAIGRWRAIEPNCKVECTSCDWSGDVDATEIKP